MTSVTTAAFRKRFGELPQDVQGMARGVNRIWLSNPRHRSLHFKRVHSTESIYSVRIGIRYRAVALVEDNKATWFWIGSHSDYDQLLRAL